MRAETQMYPRIKRPLLMWDINYISEVSLRTNVTFLRREFANNIFKHVSCCYTNTDGRTDRHKDAGAVCNFVAKYCKFKENHWKKRANSCLVKIFSTYWIWESEQTLFDFVFQLNALLVYYIFFSSSSTYFKDNLRNFKGILYFN